MYVFGFIGMYWILGKTDYLIFRNFRRERKK